MSDRSTLRVIDTENHDQALERLPILVPLPMVARLLCLSDQQLRRYAHAGIDGYIPLPIPRTKKSSHFFWRRGDIVRFLRGDAA